jgi:NTP pyrophosphatase (non-canonical NTP hydrolase)
MSKKPNSVSEWCEAAHQNSVDHGWYENGEGDNFPTKLALVHSEVSETLEEFRNGKGFNEIYYSAQGTKPEGIPVEMADILIRLFDMAGHWGIDLEEALHIKHEYNKSRPHRHGGKKI